MKEHVAKIIRRDPVLSTYQRFLNSENHKEWILLITGLDGIGKSTLLEQIKELHPTNTSLVVQLNFLQDNLCNDWLAILREIAHATAPHCDDNQVRACQQTLENARQHLLDMLSQHDINVFNTTLRAETNARADHNQMLITYYEDRVHESQHYHDEQIRAMAFDAVTGQLRTFQGRQLIILMDGYERLSLSAHQSTYQWVENTLLPGLNKQLNERPIPPNDQNKQETLRRCLIIIASRIKPFLHATLDLDQAEIMLAPFSLHESQLYLQPYNIQPKQLAAMHKLTRGHPLCLQIVYGLCSSLKPEDPLDTLSHSFYEQAWTDFIEQRVLRDFPSKSPNTTLGLYRSLIIYGSAAEFLDLPIIKQLFSDLLLSGKIPNERTDGSLPDHLDMYSNFKRLPCVLKHQVYYDCCYIHELVRTVIQQVFPHREPGDWKKYSNRIMKYCNRKKKNLVSDERGSVFMRFFRTSIMHFFKPGTQGRDHRRTA